MKNVKDFDSFMNESNNTKTTIEEIWNVFSDAGGDRGTSKSEFLSALKKQEKGWLEKWSDDYSETEEDDDNTDNPLYWTMLYDFCSKNNFADKVSW